MIPHGDDQLAQEKEIVSLVFTVLDEAIYGNAENAQFFEVRRSPPHPPAY